MKARIILTTREHSILLGALRWATLHPEVLNDYLASHYEKPTTKLEMDTLADDFDSDDNILLTP